MKNRQLNLDLGRGILPSSLAKELHQQNPWWSGRELPPLPIFRRWPFQTLLTRLLREQPLAKINVLRGPRQIGKTTLQYQIIDHLLGSGVDPKRIFRVQFDELPSFRPVAKGDRIIEIAEWYAQVILEKDLNAAAREKQPALLFLDEVQNISDWHIQLKAFVDRTDVRLLVTGSSALRIELGRDSLAGRIQTLEVGPFRLSEIAGVRKLGELPPFESGNGFGSWARPSYWAELDAHGRKHKKVLNTTFKAFSARGGYPLAQHAEAEWPEIALQLNETVVRRVIQHDLRVGERGRRRDPKLLEEMFRMAARCCGQTPRLTELAQQARDAMETNVGVQRVRTYIDFLANSLLIRTIEPQEMRLKKRRGPPKFCLSDHALRAAWLDEVVPLDPEGLDGEPELATMAGRIAESCVGYYFASLGIPVAYLPERGKEPEVDFVITGGDHRIPVEVKYQRHISEKDCAGLVNFMAKKANRSSVGVIVTRDFGDYRLPAGIVAIPFKTLLIAR